MTVYVPSFDINCRTGHFVPVLGRISAYGHRRSAGVRRGAARTASDTPVASRRHGPVYLRTLGGPACGPRARDRPVGGARRRAEPDDRSRGVRRLRRGRRGGVGGGRRSGDADGGVRELGDRADARHARRSRRRRHPPGQGRPRNPGAGAGSAGGLDSGRRRRRGPRGRQGGWPWPGGRRGGRRWAPGLRPAPDPGTVDDHPPGGFIDPPGDVRDGS